MCGIIGTIGSALPEQTMLTARDVLAHRGPNDAGLYYQPSAGVALGHRRLSIIDLSTAGHQPFMSSDGRFTLIFNGEIYNYLEIKEELAAGYDFKTKTDTEVLLAAYIRWGEKCLNKFNGMYAFAVWDREKKILFAARDRLGIKPFYYHQFGDGSLSFASEIKGLLALGVKAQANEQAIFDYLYYGLYDHGEETFFAGIKTLPAGHFLLWQNNKLTIKPYWDLAERRPANLPATYQEAQERFRELLTDAIRLQLRSDVPVGVNLSSGVDSNSLYHYAVAVSGLPLHTFSMCMKSSEFDECGLIEELLQPNARPYWHRILIKPAEVFRRAVWMNEVQGEPYGGIPTMAFALLHQEAKAQNVTVLLQGEGVDEMLAGYQYHQLAYQKDLAEAAGQASALLDRADAKHDMTMIRSATLIDADILDESFVNQYRQRDLNFAAPFSSHLLNAQYGNLRYTKLPRVLRFHDHTSMAYGRELRVPFLDHRLVEFCFHLPAEYKIRGYLQKAILRESMADIVPTAVSSKLKQDFGAVQTGWFRQYFKKEILDLLHSASFRARPWWDHEKLGKKVDDFFQGRVNNSFFIWQCFNLEIWHQRFIEGSSPTL